MVRLVRLGSGREENLHCRCHADSWWWRDDSRDPISRHSRVRSERSLHRDRHRNSGPERKSRLSLHNNAATRLPLHDRDATWVHPADTDVRQPNTNNRTAIPDPDQQPGLVRRLVRLLERLINRVPRQLTDLIHLLARQLTAQQPHVEARNGDRQRPFKHHLGDRALDQLYRFKSQFHQQ